MLFLDQTILHFQSTIFLCQNLQIQIDPLNPFDLNDFKKLSWNNSVALNSKYSSVFSGQHNILWRCGKLKKKGLLILPNYYIPTFNFIFIIPIYSFEIIVRRISCFRNQWLHARDKSFFIIDQSKFRILLRWNEMKTWVSEKTFFVNEFTKLTKKPRNIRPRKHWPIQVSPKNNAYWKVYAALAELPWSETAVILYSISSVTNEKYT